MLQQGNSWIKTRSALIYRVDRIIQYYTIMITVIAFLLNILAPIVNVLGALGLCACIVYDDTHILPIGGILAVIGLVFGIFAYRNDVPPRWFWSHSKNELFEYSVIAVLGYGWSFAAWPFAIYFIRTINEMVSNQ